MFKYFVNLKNNETQDFIIYFDVIKEVYINIWGVYPNEVHATKLYKCLEVTQDIKFTRRSEGDLFLQIFSIIFRNLNLGKINIIDNKPNDITITLEELKSIYSRFRVTLINENDILRVKELYKITKIN